jgi:hypothetical protein
VRRRPEQDDRQQRDADAADRLVYRRAERQHGDHRERDQDADQPEHAERAVGRAVQAEPLEDAGRAEADQVGDREPSRPARRSSTRPG